MQRLNNTPNIQLLWFKSANQGRIWIGSRMSCFTTQVIHLQPFDSHLFTCSLFIKWGVSITSIDCLLYSEVVRLVINISLPWYCLVIPTDYKYALIHLESLGWNWKSLTEEICLLFYGSLILNYKASLYWTYRAMNTPESCETLLLQICCIGQGMVQDGWSLTVIS